MHTHTLILTQYVLGRVCLCLCMSVSVSIYSMDWQAQKVCLHTACTWKMQSGTAWKKPTVRPPPSLAPPFPHYTHILSYLLCIGGCNGESPPLCMSGLICCAHTHICMLRAHTRGYVARAQTLVCCAHTHIRGTSVEPCIHTGKFARSHLHPRLRTHTKHTHKYTHTRTQTYTHKHTHMHTHSHTHTNTHAHMCPNCNTEHVQWMCVCVCVCVSVRSGVCVHLCVHAYEWDPSSEPLNRIKKGLFSALSIDLKAALLTIVMLMHNADIYTHIQIDRRAYNRTDVNTHIHTQMHTQTHSLWHRSNKASNKATCAWTSTYVKLHVLQTSLHVLQQAYMCLRPCRQPKSSACMCACVLRVRDSYIGAKC